MHERIPSLFYLIPPIRLLAIRQLTFNNTKYYVRSNENRSEEVTCLGIRDIHSSECTKEVSAIQEVVSYLVSNPWDTSVRDTPCYWHVNAEFLDFKCQNVSRVK